MELESYRTASGEAKNAPTPGVLPLLRRAERRPLVRRLWAIERDEQLRALRGQGIRAVSWSPDRPLEAALGALRLPDFGRAATWPG